MAKKLTERRSNTMRALVLGSSLGAIAMVGTPTVGLAQGSALEQACAAVLTLRSSAAIENVLVNYSNSPCVPLLLAALSPERLSRISPAIVAELPVSQLRRIPIAVLTQLGIRAPQGTTRSVSVPGPRRSTPAPRFTDSNSSLATTSNSSQY
jgi:hypothetical protein